MDSSKQAGQASALQGKNVLLWAPQFFGYELAIKAEVESLGARVSWIKDRPFSSPLLKALTTHAPQAVRVLSDRRHREQLVSLGSDAFDIVIVINGQTLSRKLLTELRLKHRSARFILYMWDSIENRGAVRSCIDLYDDAFTFDPVSARNFGMKFRPLFYTRGFDPGAEAEVRYDLSFIGTAHTDRYAVIKAIEKSLPSSVSHFWYFYLQAHWVYDLSRITNPHMKGAPRHDFRFCPLDKATTQSVFHGSRCILDIEHPLQRGLTIRTFEALGAQKKLITTNANIRDYDFFDSANILVIDRKFPVVPPSFLHSPYKLFSDSLMAKYSCRGWLLEILGLSRDADGQSLSGEFMQDCIVF